MALRPWPYGPVPAAAVLALGAVGAVPPGLGVVEGGEIPYKPEALAIKKQNQQDWLKRDPEIKCYLPGVPRATYMPYPLQILQSASALTISQPHSRRNCLSTLSRSINIEVVGSPITALATKARASAARSLGGRPGSPGQTCTNASTSATSSATTTCLCVSGSGPSSSVSQGKRLP